MLKNIISVFKVTEPDVMPVFVARDLEKLPPITFDHLDVSKLLKDILLVQSDIKDIKSSYATLSQLEDLEKEFKAMSVPASPQNVDMKRGARRDSRPLLLSPTIVVRQWSAVKSLILRWCCSGIVVTAQSVQTVTKVKLGVVVAVLRVLLIKTRYRARRGASPVSEPSFSLSMSHRR